MGWTACCLSRAGFPADGALIPKSYTLIISYALHVAHLLDYEAAQLAGAAEDEDCILRLPRLWLRRRYTHAGCDFLALH